MVALSNTNRYTILFSSQKTNFHQASCKQLLLVASMANGWWSVQGKGADCADFPTQVCRFFVHFAPPLVSDLFELRARMKERGEKDKKAIRLQRRMTNDPMIPWCYCANMFRRSVCGIKLVSCLLFLLFPPLLALEAVLWHHCSEWPTEGRGNPCIFCSLEHCQVEWKRPGLRRGMDPLSILK